MGILEVSWRRGVEGIMRRVQICGSRELVGALRDGRHGNDVGNEGMERGCESRLMRQQADSADYGR